MASSIPKDMTVREKIILKLILSSIDLNHPIFYDQKSYTRLTIEQYEISDAIRIALALEMVEREDSNLVLTENGRSFLKLHFRTGKLRKDCYWIQPLLDHVADIRDSDSVYLPSVEVIEELE